MQQNISVEDTNLICKINLLLAIDFLLNLSLEGQQLHGFNNCLKYQRCALIFYSSWFTCYDCYSISSQCFSHRFSQSMLLLQIGEDILGAVWPVLLIQVGEDCCCACVWEINPFTYSYFKCKHLRVLPKTDIAWHPNSSLRIQQLDCYGAVDVVLLCSSPCRNWCLPLR